MKRKIYVTGAAFAVPLVSFALVAGQVLTSSQAAFATGSTESPTPITSSASTAAPSSETPTSEAPTPEVPTPGSPMPEPSSSAPTTPDPEPTIDPAPSANPEPAPSPSESGSLAPGEPSEVPGPDAPGAAAGLPEMPADAPSVPPAAPSPQTTADSAVPRGTTPTSPTTGERENAASSGTLAPYQGGSVPSTLGSSVAGAQAPNRIDSGDGQLELFPMDGTVLGIFSSQQPPGDAGRPEWMEGFLNVSGAQSAASSSADPNQAAGVAGAETQGNQTGAVANSSVFQRGGTIMNGARPLMIFTGFAVVGLALVVLNFVWRNRAPRN